MSFGITLSSTKLIVLIAFAFYYVSLEILFHKKFVNEKDVIAKV